MTLSDYRDTISWQAAIELARPLTKLSEDLPAQEQQGLIMVLQEAMVALPAAVGNDLLAGSSTRIAVAVRLQSALEVIERVYPALDTAEPKRLLDELLSRTESNGFAEVHVAPSPPQADSEDEESQAVEVPVESV